MHPERNSTEQNTIMKEYKTKSSGLQPRKPLSAYIILAVSVLLMPLNAAADEGMWTLFTLPHPIYERMQTYGYNLPMSSLTANGATTGEKYLPAAVVNFSGYCTGVVVSPRGLVMTNHHCGFESIRRHSTVDNDIMLHGFVAATEADELPNEDMFVAFMQKQEDVTPRLKESGLDTLNLLDRDLLVDSLEDVLTREAKQLDSTLYVEIDPFYEGNAYYATTYRRYNDVRLVMALPKSLGKFGGERDNWVWPRQTCDVSIFRIYVDPVTGLPANYSKDNVPMGTASRDTANIPYIQVSTSGFNDGDFAMTLGYPGSTERYLSSYGIRQMRDCVNDPMQQVRGVKQRIMKRHMDESEAVRIKYDSKFAQSSNYWKNAIGMNKCIDSVGIIQMKRDFEQRIAMQPGAPNLDTLAALYERQREAMRAYTLYNETFTRRSNNELAIRATRYCDGKPTQNTKRKPKKQYIQFDDNNSSWDRNLDVEVLAALLRNYREQIGDTAVGQKYLPSFYETIDTDFQGDYQKYVEHVWDNSILMTTKKIPMRLTKKLRRDPGIQMSLSLVETLANIRMVLDLAKDSIEEQERLLCAAKVRMEQDQPHYSDANFTMRLSYGQVGGYTLAGQYSGFTTSMRSLIDKVNLYERDSALTVNPYEEYFLEPEIKQMISDYCDEGKDNANKFPLCFLSNNDITGGNSGSPVIDSNGKLIGLAFDGTWDSLSSDIYFDSTLARTISVDIRYILFMMRKWGHADRLLNEMKVE